MQFLISDNFIRVNTRTWDELRSELLLRLGRREGFALATLNMDHLVKLRRSKRFESAYAAQDFIVADGRPIVWLSHLARKPVELLPGSDLVEPLAGLATEVGVKIAFVGSRTSVLSQAKVALEQSVPGCDVVLTRSPDFEFDPDGTEAHEIMEELEARGVGLCFLAFGAPKQETLAQLGREIAPSVGFASVGAGLDFIGGDQRRAPRWVREFALEWLWRIVNDPRRLLPRYLKCFAIAPSLVRDAIRLRHAPTDPKDETYLYSIRPRRRPRHWFK